MGAKSAVSIDEYLRTSFEDLDREYVDGEIVERSLPTYLHSKTQTRLAAIFCNLGDRYPLFACVELRSRPGATRVRIPDVSVYAGEEPSDPVPAVPPLIAIEILSPDDRNKNVAVKLEEYRVWGVRHVWLVDPEARKLSVYGEGVLQEVALFEVPEFGLRVSPAEILR
jgi:Uma2 family endonuclease